MHIPDGFLDARTAIATGLVAAGGLGIALRQAKRTLPPRRVVLLGLSAAFIFAAQMLNFPVAGGTSGHLMGSVLAAVLLGPSGAVIVLSAVLFLQCLMFADGGISALGANICNMALVGGVGGWVIYYAVYSVVSRVFKGRNEDLFGRVLAAAFAAWCGTVLAAVACAGQLAASGTVAWSLVLPAMAGIHMLIGIGEGVITALVLVAISQTRPELIAEPVGRVLPVDRENALPGSAGSRSHDLRSYGPVVVYGLLLSLGLAVLVSPWASSQPDGLEKTAQVLDFEHHEADAIIPAPMPEYAVSPSVFGRLSIPIAGGVGTLVVFGLSWLLARTLVGGRGERITKIPANRRSSAQDSQPCRIRVS